MSSRRANKLPRDPRGGHIRLYWEIFDSAAWRVLSYSDIAVYLAMRRTLLGSNNGDINATKTRLAHFGIKSSSTIAKSLRALAALGFIEQTRQGGIARGGKSCSLYRFTDENTYDIPKQGIKATKASYDYKQFKTVAQAQAVLSHCAEEAKRKTEVTRLRKVQLSNRSASITVSATKILTSAIEYEAPSKDQNSKQDTLKTYGLTH
jgi:predicted transcriptional regulator